MRRHPHLRRAKRAAVPSPLEGEGRRERSERGVSPNERARSP